ncbi:MULTISPECIES: hypothetical protein [Streptomyces]|jgi:pimeloyl-ACP methyl ester carboxylesterase|uniref:Uncharacterized protein n=1 Tax=Streptomyces mirabilis TaxID=68239 RepID=A0ABU3UGY7_9ACTN|nr:MULTISPECIES: hypothetical protein [Streptomyces]MCX4437858.1 hypothetical protein [Streptomyces mirabilis]MCX4613111.1 hypothetical protein [Streptomyces mirabilis]MCX5353242.1 hypothetical protein [Streptomyces mirabilis]MDU8993184.1 hypothetical protein [Streptomyces mirabilis]
MANRPQGPLTGRDVRGESIAQCGHLCREERPDVVNRELLDFLTDWNG